MTWFVINNRPQVDMCEDEGALCTQNIDTCKVKSSTELGYLEEKESLEISLASEIRNENMHHS